VGQHVGGAELQLERPQNAHDLNQVFAEELAVSRLGEMNLIEDLLDQAVRASRTGV
jgi:hypothetical protein